MSTPRPRSVTLGCVYAGLGGLLASISLFQLLHGWGSIQTQEALRDALSQLGADADADRVVPALRWAVTVMLVAAIAGTVFAVFAARGHQASRIGLTILAATAIAVLALTGLAGLLPAVLAALVIYLLWSAPARAWFAVVNGRTPLSLGAAPTAARHESPAPDAPGAGASSPVPPPRPPVYDPSLYPHHVRRSARPRPVTVALLVAGIGSIVGALVSTVGLATLVLRREEVVRQYAQSDLLSRQLDSAGVTADQLVSVATALFAIWLVISVLMLAAAAWATSGRRSGRTALLVASVLTAIAAVGGLPLGAVWVIGSIVVIVQLSKAESRSWFSQPR